MAIVKRKKKCMCCGILFSGVGQFCGYCRALDDE